MDSAYAVLGIKPGSGVEDIVDAYNKLMHLLDLSHYSGTPLVELARQRRSEVEQAFHELAGHYPGVIQPVKEAIPDNQGGIKFSDAFSKPGGGAWLFMSHGNNPQQRGWCSSTCEKLADCGECCECIPCCGD